MDKRKDNKDLSRFHPLSKTRKSLIKSLNHTRRRRKEGLFIVEGRKNVLDILANGSFVPHWLIASEDFLDEYKDAIHDAWGFSDDSVSCCTESEMRECSSLSTSSDVLAVFRIPEEDGSSPWTTLSPRLYLMLDGIQDPGNLGTILRTAHWFGIRTVFASRNTVDLYNPKTVQSTMGSLGEVKVIYGDLPSIISENPDIPAVGLQLEGDNLFACQLPTKAFICMGSEGNGLSEDVRKLLKYSYTIPPAHQSHHPESLNVSVATAITLAAFCNNPKDQAKWH